MSSSNTYKENDDILSFLPLCETPESHKNIICDFKLKDTLGKGSFATVMLATNIQTDEKVAIKIIDESKLSKFEKEIQILSQLKHPNIVRLYSFLNKKGKRYIITEYIKGVELFQEILLKNKLEEMEACNYFQQIINVIEYLHKLEIMHRDIKPENILIQQNTKQIKIIDFGLSCNYSNKDYNLLSTICGTPIYTAPEILSKNYYKPKPADIWSCGVVLFFMVCGHPPFEGNSPEEILKKMKNQNYKIDKNLSKDCQDLIKQILNPKPENRITITKIKKHPWFNIYNKNNNNKNISLGLLSNKYVTPLDEDIIMDMQKCFNLSPVEIRISILANKLDDISTLYYLKVNKKKDSVSDFQSDKFIEYIQNKDNLLSNYNNDIKLVIKKRKNGVENEIKEINVNQSPKNTNRKLLSNSMYVFTPPKNKKNSFSPDLTRIEFLKNNKVNAKKPKVTNYLNFNTQFGDENFYNENTYENKFEKTFFNSKKNISKPKKKLTCESPARLIKCAKQVNNIITINTCHEEKNKIEKSEENEDKLINKNINIDDESPINKLVKEEKEKDEQQEKENIISSKIENDDSSDHLNKTDNKTPTNNESIISNEKYQKNEDSNINLISKENTIPNKKVSLKYNNIDQKKISINTNNQESVPVRKKISEDIRNVMIKNSSEKKFSIRAVSSKKLKKPLSNSINSAIKSPQSNKKISYNKEKFNCFSARKDKINNTYKKQIKINTKNDIKNSNNNIKYNTTTKNSSKSTITTKNSYKNIIPKKINVGEFQINTDNNIKKSINKEIEEKNNIINTKEEKINNMPFDLNFIFFNNKNSLKQIIEEKLVKNKIKYKIGNNEIISFCIDNKRDLKVELKIKEYKIKNDYYCIMEIKKISGYNKLYVNGIKKLFN